MEDDGLRNHMKCVNWESGRKGKYSYVIVLQRRNRRI
jgi:hypothetical protein